MDNKQSPRFNIKIDDESPDSVLEEETGDLNISKLNKKITLSSVFILVVVCAILYFLYRDIEKRYLQMHKTGSDEIENLTKNMEIRFLSLSGKYAKLKKSINQRIVSLEEADALLIGIQKTTGTTITNLKTSKVGGKKFNTAVSKINKSLASLRKDLKDFSVATKADDRKASEKLVKLKDYLDATAGEFKQIRSDINRLISDQAAQKMIDSSLEKERALFNLKINRILKNMDKSIASIWKEIEKIDKVKSNAEGKPFLPKKKFDEEASDGNLIDETGSITEEDIQ